MSQHSKKAVSSLEEAIQSMTKDRDELDHRIALMQETVAMLEGARRGPGRPPGSRNKAKANANDGTTANRAPKKKRNWSPEARAAAAERMRKAWKLRKRQAAGGK